MPTNTAHPASDALTNRLASSEAEVLRILWAHGPLKLQPIYQQIAGRRDVAYKSVKTAIDRLAEKGLLHCEKAQRGFGWVYRPTIGERGLIAGRLTESLTTKECD
jgi:predicted transcriptional regulator